MRVSNVTVRKRLIFILISGILIFTIIDIRLGYVQFFLGNMLTDRAKDSWSRNITFEPERGKILDRNFGRAHNYCRCAVEQFNQCSHRPHG